MSSQPNTPHTPHAYTLFGVCHHPNYDITSASSSSSSHFQRTPHGDRLAPLSQLNSFRGRALAYTTTPESTSTPPPLHLGTFDFEEERTPPLGSPRAYTVSHDTSQDFPTPLARTRSVSVASSARSRTRGSKSSPRAVTSLAASPHPPRISVPPMVKCAGCVLVPGFLVNEFRRVFDACRVCGQLTGEGVQELVVRKGEVDGGREVSREMEGWFGEVVWEWGEVVGLRRGRRS